MNYFSFLSKNKIFTDTEVDFAGIFLVPHIFQNIYRLLPLLLLSTSDMQRIPLAERTKEG